MSAKTDRIIVTKEAYVGAITLNQPQRHNAIALDMWKGLREAVRAFAADPQVRVVVVSGAGERAFSAGADISQFDEQRATKADIDAYDAVATDVYHALTTLEKPTVAKIRGYCIGGGLGLALCCDLRLSADDATFAIPAAKLGLAYSYDDVETVSRLVGPSFAKEILYTGRQFDASEALQMGLVNRVVPAAELGAYVADYAAVIAANAPLTVQAAKQTVAEAMKDPGERDLARVAGAIAKCYASADYEEGRRAFVEKRKPRFSGQ